MFSEIKWLNVIQWAISILTVAVGIWQFSTQQRQANSTPFLQKQLELAFQSSETASILATETNMEKWEQARQRFWVLYWGPLSLVESPEVAAEMVKIGEILPKEAGSNPVLPMAQLRPLSYHLAKANRDLVLKSWHIQMPDLDPNK